MATQLLHPVKGAPLVPKTEKDSIDKRAQEETYLIYSVYYSNEPEGGHVVYASTGLGWEFFGDIAARSDAHLVKGRLSRGKFSHL